MAGLSARRKALVAAATVKLPNKGGQGVLVPGPYILTAAHCVEWYCEGGMALGDYCLEQIKTRDGRKFRAQVRAVEPVADVAAIGPADDQGLPEDFMAFLEFAEAVAGVQLYTRTVEPDDPVSVQVLTHRGRWVGGQMTRYGFPGAPNHGTLCIDAKSPIRSGTSGGPIVDGSGRLIGLVSWSSEQRSVDTYVGASPVPWLALPRWVLDRIAEAEKTPQDIAG